MNEEGDPSPTSKGQARATTQAMRATRGRKPIAEVQLENKRRHKRKVAGRSALLAERVPGAPAWHRSAPTFWGVAGVARRPYAAHIHVNLTGRRPGHPHRRQPGNSSSPGSSHLGIARNFGSAIPLFHSWSKGRWSFSGGPCFWSIAAPSLAALGGGAMDETEELIRLCVRSLAAQMCAAPGAELRMTRSCFLGLSDEPSADHNRMILGADPEAEDFLVRSVARAKARGRPFMAVMSPRAAESLAPVATRLGLAAVATAPLMVLRPEVPVRPAGPVKIFRTLGPELTGAAGDLIAAAFDEPRDVIARCIEVSMTPTSGVETYLALDETGPLCTVSVTPTGDTAGITLMATSPERQRKGLGRAVLSRVIEDYRARGVTRFHLGATDAGRRLYDSLGFELVADLPVWILPQDG